MKTENVIKLGVDSALKNAQFRRKSNTWYRDLEETVILVNLQRSNFGDEYYINLAVWVKGLPSNAADKLPPNENECHIRLRIETLNPADEDQVKQLLNLEDGTVDAGERQDRLREVIVEGAVPFLLQCSTLAGIRDAQRQGRLAQALVHKSIRDSVLR